MSASQSGLTRIEGLIVAGIFVLLALVLAPQTTLSNSPACALADEMNLRWQFQWLLDFHRKHNALPNAGGHEFVLAAWTANVIDHTPENFDRFWTPGPARDDDQRYVDGFHKMKRGENPWPTLEGTTSGDTHYCGRSKAHAASSQASADEAWMADDNEGGWNLRDGTIHVLFCGGRVRSYSYAMLKEQFGLGDFRLDVPVVTHGAGSPIEPCKKLDL